MRLHSAKARGPDRICVCVRACDCWTGSGCCWLLSDDCAGVMWKCSLYLSASVSLPFSLSLTHTYTHPLTHTHAALRLKLSFSPLISPLGIFWSGWLRSGALHSRWWQRHSDCHVKIMNIWCRRELLQVVCLLLWLTHIDESWVPSPVIPCHAGYLIAICFCKKVVHGKLYCFGLRCVPQACKGLIYTPLSTLVLVFAVHLFI